MFKKFSVYILKIQVCKSNKILNYVVTNSGHFVAQFGLFQIISHKVKNI